MRAAIELDIDRGEVYTVFMNGNGDKENDTRRGKQDDELERRRRVRLIFTVLAAVFAVGAVVCIVCYIALKNDMIFIPFAACIVVAMLMFTYARVK